MKARYEYDAEEIQRLIEEDIRARGHVIVPGDVAVPPEYAVSVSVWVAAAAPPPPPPPPVSPPPAASSVATPSAAASEPSLDASMRPPPERTWNSIEGIDGDPRLVPPPVRHDYVPRVRELGAPKDARRLSPENPWTGQAPYKQPRDTSTSERLLDALYPDEDPAPAPALDVLASAPDRYRPVPGSVTQRSGPAGEGGIDTSFLDTFLRR